MSKEVLTMESKDILTFIGKDILTPYNYTNITLVSITLKDYRTSCGEHISYRNKRTTFYNDNV